MAIEAKRGCGFRKVGGLYLVGTGEGIPCDRLPYELKVCPCCGAGIKPARGITWFDAKQFFKTTHGAELESTNKDCLCPGACPVCYPQDGKYGLLWVGEKYYPGPRDFIQEAQSMGISRRISQLPKNLKLGETWIMLAHRKAITRQEDNWKKVNKTLEQKDFIKDVPGIFYVFRPQRVEKIITDKQATPRRLKKLEKRGITPVIVPHDDPDHNPTKRRKS